LVSLRESFQADICSTLRERARGRGILIGSAVAWVVSVLVLGEAIVPNERHSSLRPVAAYLTDLAVLSGARESNGRQQEASSGRMRHGAPATRWSAAPRSRATRTPAQTEPADSTGRCNTPATASADGVSRMKRRPRIDCSENQKALMCKRWIADVASRDDQRELARTKSTKAFIFGD
jgi:hypothetical protein